jgi:hypothetical protein
MTILSALVAQAGVAGEAARAGGYQIERSLRFNSADSAYLNRTPGTASNRQTWTWSGWVKRGLLTSGEQVLFSAGSSYTIQTYFSFYIGSDNKLVTTTGSFEIWRTTQVFRDPAAWYHIVLVVDTTQATEDNRTRLYINGAEVTSFTRGTNLSQNTDYGINYNIIHYIGRDWFQPVYFGGYLTEINFIDGSALDPTSFGEYNSETGVWQPIEYTGSYGTNGFYLNFSDNSTTDALGTDFSGNDNTWDDNGFSVTAGVDNDSLVDTPTNYGSDTGAGGTVRGNYATLNPIFNPNGTIVTYANGNLDFSHSASVGNAPKMVVMSTIAIPLQGKWYWEYTIGSTVNDGVGISNELVVGGGARGSASAAYNDGGSFSGDYTNPASAGSFSAGNIIGMAYDQSAGTLAFYKSNVLQGTITNISTTVTFFPYREPGSSSTSGAGTFNFGQRPFAYTAPSGFKALCTQNLPEPTIKDGSEYFDVVTYNGNGVNVASGGQTISSLDFRPDWVWIKKRTGTPMTDHALFDVVRGANLQLQSNNTLPESSMTEALVSFTGNGFTLGNSSNVNLSSNAYVAWNWAAGGEPTANNNSDGNIISTVSVSTESGFSIVTYTGNGTAGATVGHGLGVAPSMVIVKERQNTNAWCVYHSSIGATKFLRLNGTDAENTQTDIWNDTAPTSTVFSVGDAPATNRDANNLVAYCFAAIPGYSAFGSYKGNADPDGPFVYTGFRPAFLIIKRTTGDSWLQRDSVRNPYNVTDLMIIPNLAAPEYVDSTLIDFVSNGFKLRHQNSLMNQNGTSHIYMAFAENPFKYSLAR